MFKFYQSIALKDLSDIVEKEDAVILDANIFSPLIVYERRVIEKNGVSTTYDFLNIIDLVSIFIERNYFLIEIKNAYKQYMDSISEALQSYKIIAPVQLIQEVERHHAALVNTVRYFKLLFKDECNKRKKSDRFKKTRETFLDKNLVFDRIFPFLKLYKKWIGKVIPKISEYNCNNKDVQLAVNLAFKEVHKKIEKGPSDADKALVASAVSYSISNGGKSIIVSRDRHIKQLLEELMVYCDSKIDIFLLNERYSKNKGLVVEKVIV